MLDRLDSALATVRDVVGSLDSDAVSESDAARMVEQFAEFERLTAAGRTIVSRRVEKSRVWWKEGYQTPAKWLAARAQTTVAAAVTTLETGRRLEDLPATREAFMAGGLSGLQAAEITRAAAADPASEGSLLEAAASEAVAGLRERCHEVVAAANTDGDADERIHRSRYLRHWVDGDGAVRLDARLTPDAGARLVAVIQARGRGLREQARRAGSRERKEASAADALISLVDAASPATRAVVHVHVDEAAWTRGRLERGERCRIAGLGPVSVAAARRLV